MEVHLIDGTYELFRHYHALPSMRDSTGQEVAAVRGVLTSILGMIEKGATHLGVATDHVIESFRNQIWAEYKTGEGVEADLLAQFPLLEEALSALGVVVWPMVEFEADDALARRRFRCRERPCRRTSDYLHARQRPLAMRSRNPGRPARPTQKHHSRRGGRDCEVRCRTVLDPRLPGARRRCCGWIPWVSRLGSEIYEQRPCPLSSYRVDSGKLARLGRRCRESVGFGRDSSSGSRTSLSCFATWRPCAPIYLSSNLWKSYDGQGRLPPSQPLAARLDASLSQEEESCSGLVSNPEGCCSRVKCVATCVAAEDGCQLVSDPERVPFYFCLISHSCLIGFEATVLRTTD